MREVPKGWLEVELADVWHESRGRARPNAIALTEYIGLEHVESGTNRILAKGRSDDVKSAVAVFAAGDVLYGRLRPYLNKVIRPTFAGVASTEFLVFKETQALANAFLMHLLSSSDLVGYANANSAGVNLPRVSAKWLAKYRFLLAPLPEQHRIVARIESLFARLDAGIAALKRAEANLERYWASVLKAAVEGRFTERWRRENPPEETGEELLQRILAERRKRWEAEQLANFEARGKEAAPELEGEVQGARGTGHERVAGTTGRVVLGQLRSALSHPVGQDALAKSAGRTREQETVSAKQQRQVVFHRLDGPQVHVLQGFRIGEVRSSSGRSAGLRRRGAGTLLGLRWARRCADVSEGPSPRSPAL